MNDLHDNSITNGFWSQTWTIPNIFTAMPVKILDYIVQSTELRWRPPLGSERLGKYSKFVTASQHNTIKGLLESYDTWKII